jgi:outer membrane protein OmpA-like peptidoglycan-associated protein
VHAEAPAIAAGLSRPGYLASPDLLPPAFMTREQAEGPQPRRRSSGGGVSSLPASIDGVLDVFAVNSAQVDEARYADKLQAFYWRLKRYQRRRLLLTGLLKVGETGGEALSRERAREISRRLVAEGGFEGEFILKVDPKPGDAKGVRIEVLQR